MGVLVSRSGINNDQVVLSLGTDASCLHSSHTFIQITDFGGLKNISLPVLS